MGEGRRHTAFDTAHPAVAAVYVGVTLALTMCSLQPVLVTLSLAGGFSYACCVRGPRAALVSLRWQLPLVVLIALVNPLFSASGSTELWRIGPRAIYLESLCYGCAMGALLVASALWFQTAARLLPFDRVMALFSRRAPVVALMISQCMRLIPRFVREGKLVAAVQDAAVPRAAQPAQRVSSTVRGRLRFSTVLMGWTLEDSLETADAMRARGWGAAVRRTSYVRYRFTAADAGRLVALALGGLVCAALAFTATSQFQFYPRLSTLVAWWGYVPYGCWMLVPTIGHLIEMRRFR